jgi:hypothetical protein
VFYRDRYPTIDENTFTDIKNKLGKHAKDLIEDRLKIEILMESGEKTAEPYDAKGYVKDSQQPMMSYNTPYRAP